jgi:hypothetical protein
VGFTHLKLKSKMKIHLFALTILKFFVAGLVLSGFTHSEVNAQEQNNAGANFEIPAPMMTLLNKSCTDCHNSNSDDEAAKKTLLIDEMQHLQKNKLTTALQEIAVSVANQMMPPRKFLKSNPDKALTKDEIEQLADWADDEAQRIIGK